MPSPDEVERTRPLSAKGAAPEGSAPAAPPDKRMGEGASIGNADAAVDVSVDADGDDDVAENGATPSCRSQTTAAITITTAIPARTTRVDDA